MVSTILFYCYEKSKFCIKLFRTLYSFSTYHILTLYNNSLTKLLFTKFYLRIKFEMLWHFQLTGHKQFSILKVPFSFRSHNLSDKQSKHEVLWRLKRLSSQLLVFQYYAICKSYYSHSIIGSRDINRKNYLRLSKYMYEYDSCILKEARYKTCATMASCRYS